MACKKLFVSDSCIQGIGLHTAEPIKAGEIVMLWNVGATIIAESEYNARQDLGDDLIKITGVRYVGDYFLHTDDKPRYENYINHSFNPNILYHCGVCFALEDIDANAELTVDYTYLLSESDVMGFIDGKTKAQVRGLQHPIGLLNSCSKLQKLLESTKNKKYDKAVLLDPHISATGSINSPSALT